MSYMKSENFVEILFSKIYWFLKMENMGMRVTHSSSMHSFDVHIKDTHLDIDILERELEGWSFGKF